MPNPPIRRFCAEVRDSDGPPGQREAEFTFRARKPIRLQFLTTIVALLYHW